jgi:hypothetical protein
MSIKGISRVEDIIRVETHLTREILGNRSGEDVVKAAFRITPLIESLGVIEKAKNQDDVEILRNWAEKKGVDASVRILGRSTAKTRGDSLGLMEAQQIQKVMDIILGYLL